MLSLRTYLSYGFGHVLNDLCASMWFTYLIIYYTYVLLFPSFISGINLLIGQIADGLCTPLVGFLSDKRHNNWFFNFYGNRKSWHLIGTLAVLTTFPFIFGPCILCPVPNQYWQVFYYASFICLFQFGWAAVQVSHLSLVPDITKETQERTSLLAIRYTFTVLSYILVNIVSIIVFRSGKHSLMIGPEFKNKFQVVALLVLGVGFLASVIFHLGVVETGHVESKETEDTKIVVTPMTLLKEFKVYQTMIVYMTSQLVVNQSAIYIPLYLHEYIKVDANRLPTLPLAMFLGGFLISIFVKPLNYAFGRKLAFTVGAFTGVAACIWVYFGHGKFYCRYTVYVVVILFGCCSSIISITSLGIIADLIGKDTKNSAFTYGIMSFADKVSNGVTVMIVQSVHQSLKKYCVEDSFYRNIVIIVCGGSCVLGIIFVFLLPTESVNPMKDANNEKQVAVNLTAED